MTKLIPVIYRNMNYPSHIEANIHELSGNFYKEKLIVNSPYSLHTEPSHGERIFCSKIVNELKYIKEAQKDNIPQLWHNKEWANEFFIFVECLIGSNNPPKVLEIHPPFDDYCKSFDIFLDMFDVFYQKFRSKYPETTVVIENRFGTRYKGGNFLLSKCSDVLKFVEILSKSNLNLKIVLDYPQLFSAETKNDKKSENWMGSNPLQLVEKIISFNRVLEKYRETICGLHIYGKLKTGNRWTTHAGNIDTFFCNNNELKHMFLKSVFSTFNDDIARYFVPEVHSGENDLHSIVADMEEESFIFLSKNKSVKAFYSPIIWGIKIPEKNIEYRESGFFEKEGWLIQFCFGKKDGKEYMDCYCRHKMTNDRHMRIYEDETGESLPALDYYHYDSDDPEDEQKKGNEILKLLREKGFFPFPSYGHVYEGDFVDGKLHGKGKYNFSSGYAYEGDLVNGIPNGKGKTTLANGDVYEGDLVDGKRHGMGKYTYGNGVYEGVFVDGKQHGKGRMTFANFGVYEGDFVEGKQHGKGKITFVNGEVYEGDFVDDKPHGKGNYTWANGRVYEGDFVNGNRTGNGKMTYANGDVYDGGWADGNQHGKGKVTCANGDFFEGDFVDGKPYHGKGKRTYPNGKIEEGDWKNGEFVGK